MNREQISQAIIAAMHPSIADAARKHDTTEIAADLGRPLQCWDGERQHHGPQVEREMIEHTLRQLRRLALQGIYPLRLSVMRDRQSSVTGMTIRLGTPGGLA